MTFQETIRSLASKFGIGGLEAEDGNVALSIDGMDALLADGGSGMLVATGYLGVPPRKNSSMMNLKPHSLSANLCKCNLLPRRG